MTYRRPLSPLGQWPEIVCAENAAGYDRGEKAAMPIADLGRQLCAATIETMLNLCERRGGFRSRNRCEWNAGGAAGPAGNVQRAGHRSASR